MPVCQWNYRVDDPGNRHIGPTAQDFYEAFGLGGDDKTISTIDPAGIALAAIKELHKKYEVRELNARVERLESQLRKLLTATGQPREGK